MPSVSASSQLFRTNRGLNHPCFNESVCNKVGRIHLPVAKRCNLKCNYCSNSTNPRKTEKIIGSDEALAIVGKILDKMYESKFVVGVSGPGDALFNRETFEVLKSAKETFDVPTCLCTNGLLLPQKIGELNKIGLEYITITINAVDVSVAEKIYSHAFYNGKLVKGSECAKILIKNQMKGLRLASKRMPVKINSVLIPGVNDEHLIEVAERIGEYACIQNIIPLFPTGKFSNFSSPSKTLVESVKKKCEKYLNQMRHCAFCRADAAGIVGESKTIFC